MKKKIFMRGPILTQSGYGEHARLIYRALKTNENFDIYVEPTTWGRTSWLWEDNQERRDIDALVEKTYHYISNGGQFDIAILVSIPTEWERLAPLTIGVTAGIETSKVSAAWIEKANLSVDKIIVPSEFSKNIFESTSYKGTHKPTNKEMVLKLNVPIEVINYPIKTTKNEQLDLNFDYDFNFLLIAQWGPRKNVENTVRWFIEEFIDQEVGLVLKVNVAAHNKKDEVEIQRRLKNILNNYPERKCKIYLIHGYMSDDEIHSLYNHSQIKSLVSIAHGEGYGLPIFEAAYSGMPVITHDWGGQTDFLYTFVKDKKGKLKKKALYSKVEYDLAPIQKEAVWPGVLEEGSQWAFPKQGSFKMKLRKVYKEYPVHKGIAKKLQKVLFANFTQEKIYQQIVDSIGIYSYEKQEAYKNLNTKEITKMLKRNLKRMGNNDEKIKLLKNKYEGKTCYMISCGPSLLDHDHKELKKKLKGNLVFTIKQAYDLFKEEADFHIYNCANYKKYDYGDHEPIIIEASTMPREFGSYGPNDCHFHIKERQFGQSLAVNKNFDDWILDKQSYVRPYGPGIEYEIIFHLAQHLGVKELITVGWDNKRFDDSSAKKKMHFYSGTEKENEIVANKVSENVPLDELQLEERITVEAIGDWYKWLKSEGTELKIISDLNPAPDYVPRLSL